jgi:uncharacterized protein HemX
MEENQNTTPAPEQPIVAAPTTVPEQVPTPISVDTETPEVATDPMTAPTAAEPIPQLTAHASGGKKHLVAIVVAVVVMLGLIGAVVYVYLKQNSTAIKTVAPKTSQSSNSSQAPVSAADVDNTAKAVDDSLQTIDANKDFSSTDLSDATLGL